MQTLNGDTLFCFSRPQARTLAKLLISGSYSDSISNSISLENQRLYVVLEKKDKLINNLNLKIEFTSQIIDNQGQNLRFLKEHLKKVDKKLTQSRRQKKWMLVSLISLTIFSVIK
ncbi:hypothetical protein QQ008_07740 [Fulvivirgaceae bacterium BMA10]|uniref:Uncharacterized protein n=1 Tax=Splendidivirga corallicola TaxID=3051826 RepID=A0ABT8KLY5_9BACT|nr:hypothetical protein [Fulvivirgaceae bacterium BMA10]